MGSEQSGGPGAAEREARASKAGEVEQVNEARAYGAVHGENYMGQVARVHAEAEGITARAAQERQIEMARASVATAPAMEQVTTDAQVATAPQSLPVAASATLEANHAAGWTRILLRRDRAPQIN